MKATQIFPTILMTMDILSACVYGFTTGDWRKIIYWLSAAVLTASVTF